MKVSEIFTSIQGESSYAGFPCTFIRLAGCNLSCSYCDTLYASRTGAEGVEYSMDEIIKEVRVRAFGPVEITGGEPLIDPETPELVSLIADEGLTVLVETNGSLSLRGLDPRAVVIMDVKTPGSGMDGCTDQSNIELLKRTDEVKFVLTSRADYEWAKEYIYRHSLIERCGVLLSPAFGMLHPESLAAWMLEDRVGARLNLQLHKYIWGPDARGV